MAGLYFLGLFLVFGTLLKPSFFWHSSQCLNVRRCCGDQGTQFFYYGLGSLLLVIPLSYFINSLTHFAIALILAILVFWWFYSKSQKQFSLSNFSAKINPAKLRRDLLEKVDSSIAERLIDYEKSKNPGKSESWYLEKVIYDLRRGR